MDDMDFIHVLSEGISSSSSDNSLQSGATMIEAVMEATPMQSLGASLKTHAQHVLSSSSSSSSASTSDTLYETMQDVFSSSSTGTNEPFTSATASLLRVQPITWISMPDIHTWYKHLSWNRFVTYMWYVWFQFIHGLVLMYQWVNAHIDLTVNVLACIGMGLLVGLILHTLRHPEQSVYDRQLKRKPMVLLDTPQR
jgi:hypothetical protein